MWQSTPISSWCSTSSANEFITGFVKQAFGFDHKAFRREI